MLISNFPKGSGTSEHRGSGTLAEETETPGQTQGLLVPKQLAQVPCFLTVLPPTLAWLIPDSTVERARVSLNDFLLSSLLRKAALQRKAVRCKLCIPVRLWSSQQSTAAAGLAQPDLQSTQPRKSQRTQHAGMPGGLMGELPTAPSTGVDPASTA